MLFGIFILLSYIAFCESIRATTEGGKTVILHQEGTWEYQEAPRYKSSAPSSIISYSKPSSAKKLFKGRKVSYQIWIDTDKWKITPSYKKSANAEFQFHHVSGEAWGMIIAERVTLNYEALKKSQLMRIETSFIDGKYTCRL